MSFTDGKPHIATAEECKAPWGGVKNGKNFRCGFCGHKFVPGDKYRWLFTNDMPGYGGNPFVCERCNDTTTVLRQRWREKCDEYKSPKWWWFRR